MTTVVALKMLGAFLIGAIPFAVVAMLGSGIDIRKVGSGNPGFNNVLRVDKKRAVLALIGDLGAGKTVFARAFINARADTAQDVPSPTFTLVQTYQFTDTDSPGGDLDGPGGGIPVYHFDLFRIEDAGEIDELGMEEAFAGGISLIEWPERLNGLLPVDRLDVTLTQGKGAGERRCVLTGHGSWVERLA